MEQLFPIEREGFFLMFARISFLKHKWTFEFKGVILNKDKKNWRIQIRGRGSFTNLALENAAGEAV